MIVVVVHKFKIDKTIRTDSNSQMNTIQESYRRISRYLEIENKLKGRPREFCDGLSAFFGSSATSNMIVTVAVLRNDGGMIERASELR